MRYSTAARWAALSIVGNLYIEFGQKIPSPPTDDFIELSKRIYKGNDNQLKIANLKTLIDITKARPGNLSGSTMQECIKVLIRYGNEKFKEIKIRSAKALRNIVSKSPNSVLTIYEHLAQTCIKGMEENTDSVFYSLLGELFALQIDPKFDWKTCSPSRRNMETYPKSIMDAIFYVTQYYSKNSQHEVKVGLIKALDIALKKFLKDSLHSTSDINTFLENIIGIPRLSIGNDYDNWRIGENLTWLLYKCIAFYLSVRQVTAALSYILNKLTELKSQVHDSGVIEMETSSKRFTDPLIEIQVTVLLSTLSLIFSRVIPERDLPPHGENLYKPILCYLSCARLSKTASRVLGSLTYKYPSIHFQLLHLLLTYTTIAHAELAGLKPEQCTKESFQDCMNSLLGNSLALATIIKCSPAVNRGIPNEISSTVLNTVKAMISGEYQGEVVDDENVFKDEGLAHEINNVKREAGWILVEALMHLGPSWVGGCLTSIFSLWKLPFGRQSCIIEENIPVHKLVSEVIHKRAASSSLLAFIKNNTSLLNPQIFKLISVFLANALQFVCPQKKSTVRKQLLDQHCQQGDLILLKKNLFECLKYVSTQYLANKIPLLLHPICSEIVSDKINSFPSIHEEWLSPEDHYLNLKKSPHPLFELSQNCYQEYLSDNLLWKPYQDKNQENIPKGAHHQDMINTALIVFSEIFTSPNFNVSNRQKLFKYLSQHLSNSLKLKENSVHKYLKMTTILLATLGALRKLALARAVITDSELITSIRAMFDSVESISHQLVKRIYAEGMIYLCKVMADPQQIPVFIKEVEHRIILSEHNPGVKSAIVLLVAGMYKHFDIALMEKNQLSLGHIIQSISRDAEVGGWAIHALYKIYNLCGHRVEAIIKATFPLGFHHYLDFQGSGFNFRESMLMLCMKYLQLNEATQDLLYLRSEMVWEDRWEASSYGLECSSSLIQNNVKLDFNRVFEVAIAKLPSQDAVDYFLDLLSFGYGAYFLVLAENLIYELFIVFDEWDSWKNKEELKKFEEVIESLLIIEANKNMQKSIEMLKAIITSVEAETAKEEAHGLSSHDDRETTKISIYKHHFTHYSKTLALKFLIFLISTYPNALPVEELINLGCHLASTESESLKILGLKLIRKIYKVCGHIKDDEDPNKLMIELYEAQVSAIIRECINSKNINIEIQANKLLLQFLITPGTQETSVVNKILAPLVSGLSETPKIAQVEGYSDHTCAKLFLSKLVTLSKLLLDTPHFIQSLLLAQKSLLIANLNAIVTDMSVIFTQPKLTLKSYEFVLGHQVVDQDHPKMGKIEVLVYALAYLADSESPYLAMLIADIYIFLFLPYNASRESAQFKNQLEVDYFMHRRKQILKALQLIISYIKDSRVIKEVISGLELCAKVPDIEHKKIVLKICSGICSDDAENVKTIEKLITVIKEMHKEIEKECMESWSWCAIQYSEILQNEGLDEHTDVTQYMKNMAIFFEEAIKGNYIEIVKETIEKIWTQAETFEDFKGKIANKVIASLIKIENYEVVIDFLVKRNIEDLSYFSGAINELGEILREFSQRSIKITSHLSQFIATSPPVLPHLIPHIFSIFQLKKNSEFSTYETNMQSEALKILLLLFKNSPDKNKALRSIIPMILSLYSSQTTLPLIKTVTKALQHLAATCSAAFKEIILSLPDHEKKFLEKQLISSQQVGPAVASSQPTITLQLKLKKP
ncbi:unnamed protein product [Blepharisma stoltei]|uniref:LAA1-like C-terminal TPR repeats domain-containing protein n=1 Tax=Blepharisma stoltei TaxID=1481888 RepID=A0AAU9J5D6_9CILI|nr:unnamed protein product [Blepharisma stoltei]